MGARAHWAELVQAWASSPGQGYVDVGDATVFGQHALAYAFLAYAAEYLKMLELCWATRFGTDAEGE